MIRVETYWEHDHRIGHRNDTKAKRYTRFEALKLFVSRMTIAAGYQISDDSIEILIASPRFDSTGGVKSIYLRTAIFSGEEEDMKVLFSYAYYLLQLAKELFSARLAVSKEEACDNIHSTIGFLMTGGAIGSYGPPLSNKEEVYKNTFSRLNVLTRGNKALEAWDLLPETEKQSSSMGVTLVQGILIALDQKGEISSELREKLQGIQPHAFSDVCDEFIDSLA